MVALRSPHLSGWLRLSASAVLLTAKAFGADQTSESCRVAALRNGFAISYTRSEVVGGATRLWVCPDEGVGYVEVATGEVADLTREQVPHIETRVIQAKTVLPEQAKSVLPAEDPIGTLIATAASRHQIDPDFVSSLVKAESAFDPAALSIKGAGGLMQLMPRTAAALGVTNVFDPAANVEAGTKYLRDLLDQYHGDAVKALAAYNAGPGRVEQYGGVPPFRETRLYIARIIDDYNRKKEHLQASGATALSAR